MRGRKKPPYSIYLPNPPNLRHVPLLSLCFVLACTANFEYGMNEYETKVHVERGWNTGARG